MGGGGGGGGGGGIPLPFPETTFTSTGLEDDDLLACFFFSFSRLPITLLISILFVLPSHNSTIGLEGPVDAGVELVAPE